MNQTKIAKKIRSNVRGQIALFLALAFPVLFVLFAMVVNVGILVNQKINLQNSVDLAAYYGAMRQAQVMNAIAHVNYQIHQSWKLLVFRYRQLGSAGESNMHPYNHANGTLRASANTDQAFACSTAFCMNYGAWEQMTSNENYCRDQCNQDATTINLPGAPSNPTIPYGLAATLLAGITSQIIQYSQNALHQVQYVCQKASAMNWLLLAEYLWLYKADVQNRKRIINRLANSISFSDRYFLDIDGGQVGSGGGKSAADDGAFQTFYKNLTAQNQASIGKDGRGQGASFEFYNGLGGSESCKGNEGNEKRPPAWLAEVFAKPIFAFRDADCTNPLTFYTKIINAGDDRLPRNKDQITPQVLNFLSDYIVDPASITDESRLYHTTLNYEKNPWCMSYVEVKAKTQPKIPFLPFGPITITAKAAAKPFGGSIGPWYYKRWPAMDTQSRGQINAQAPAGDDRVDKALPPRIDANVSSVPPSMEALKADYSRYVGDLFGTKSTVTMGRMGQAIYEKNKDANRLKVSWWLDILGGQDFSSVTGNGDLLAWDKDNNVAPPIRKLEVAAIAPDQFDATYYSVEPDFWRTYGLRLQRRTDFGGVGGIGVKGIEQTGPQAPNTGQLAVRGDIGFRKDAPEKIWQTFGVRDQIEMAHQSPYILDYNKLTYYVGANKSRNQAYFEELLTSWHYKNPGDYTIDDARFGKCPDNAIVAADDTSFATQVSRAIPGNCFAGGRVGYSVKLVDPSFLQTEMQLGGEGQSGTIANKPPSTF